MQSIRGLEEVYEKIFRTDGCKFLGFVKGIENLKFLESLLGTDLGVKRRSRRGKEPRKRRHFIGWYMDGKIVFIFLTTSTGLWRSYRRVDLTLCPNVSKRCPDTMEEAYVLDSEDRGFVSYLVREEVVEGKYVICGWCKDLEYLENLKIIEV